MTLLNQNKLAKHLLRLLKVDEIIFPICRTSKGNFGLRYGVNTDDYEMYLDAVPLPAKDILKDENNIELKKMLDKYLFEQMVEVRRYQQPVIITTRPEFGGPSLEAMSKPEIPQDKPKRGRPAGSKNGKKAN